jgi:hypothetical protein
VSDTAWVAKSQERAVLSVAIVIGMRRQLIDDGWDEKRAEQAVLAVLMGKLNA